MDEELSYREMAASAIESFDISSYARAASLSILDWRAVISYREHMSLNLEPRMRSERSWHGDRLKADILRITKDPLSTLRAAHRTYDPTVTDMTVLDAWGFRTSIELHRPRTAERIEHLDELEEPKAADLSTLSDEEIDELMGLTREAEDLHCQLSIPYRLEMKSEEFDETFAYLCVDCSAPDEVMISHFKEWLAAYRKAEGKRSKSISEADMRKWAQHRVLPYIDLKILSALAGKELTNYAIGCLIFPDLVNVDIAEKVRKTTAPLADWLLGEDGGNALFAVANAEQRKLVGKNWG